MNHALAVSAVIGSILDNDHTACLKSYNLAPAGSVCQYISILYLVCPPCGQREKYVMLICACNAFHGMINFILYLFLSAARSLFL